TSRRRHHYRHAVLGRIDRVLDKFGQIIGLYETRIGDDKVEIFARKFAGKFDIGFDDLGLSASDLIRFGIDAERAEKDVFAKPRAQFYRMRTGARIYVEDPLFVVDLQVLI